MMGPAFAGSMGGAALASFVPKDFFKPFIVFLLILVAIYTWRKPELGMAENLKFTHKKRLIIVGLIGLMIGFYDGIFGPGTGTFLVFFLVSTIGYAFLKASATAKLVNIATNAGAILSFQLTGHIWWQLGEFLAQGGFDLARAEAVDLDVDVEHRHLHQRVAHATADQQRAAAGVTQQLDHAAHGREVAIEADETGLQVGHALYQFHYMQSYRFGLRLGLQMNIVLRYLIDLKDKLYPNHLVLCNHHQMSKLMWHRFF